MAPYVTGMHILQVSALMNNHLMHTRAVSDDGPCIDSKAMIGRSRFSHGRETLMKQACVERLILHEESLVKIQPGLMVLELSKRFLSEGAQSKD